MYVFTIPAVWTKRQHHWTSHDIINAHNHHQSGRWIYADANFTEPHSELMAERGCSANGYLHGGGETEEDF